MQLVPPAGIFVATCLIAWSASGASPPAAPVILEPGIELQELNGTDVHMVTAQFADPDGDQHLCTDWEIREGEEVVWYARCATGPQQTHIHLGDGVFAGTHTGGSELHADGLFGLRVRHRSDSGDPETEWSEWSSRQFRTALPTSVRPMLLAEVMTEPQPRWTGAGQDVDLPPGAMLELQTVHGDALVRFGASGIDNAEPRSTSVIVRLLVRSGDFDWILPESEVSFEDGLGGLRTVYLPAIVLPPGGEAVYWISENGSTHTGSATDRTPDFTNVARGAPVPWTFERGFRAEVFASGFELPVSVVVAHHQGNTPDSPLLYVAELYGQVKVVTRGGEVREFARGLLNFDPRAPIPGDGERGLAGITVDPANGDVIVTGVYQVDPSSQWTSPRVLRLQSDDGGLTAARVVPVIEFPGESMAPSHQISNVTFGPDDKLYVHVGSSFAWIAQDLNTIDGKILRMNRDGSAPADNPFYDASNGITATDYIFALGFRNPFGGAWRIADGSLYEVENGPATDRLAMVVRGRNYLWDGFDPSMLNYAIYNWTLPVAPIQIAFTEPERFDASGFPASKHRSAFVTESGSTWATGPQKFGKKISEFVLGLDGSLFSGPTTFAEYTGSGKSTAAGLAAGPDGLFFTDLYREYAQGPFDAGANVLRIQWAGFADFGVRFAGPSSVALRDRSEVPDAGSISWDFGDGTTSREPSPVHTYEHPGTYLIRQTVAGSRGVVTEARRVFAGEDAPPPVHAEYFASPASVSPIFTETRQALDFDWSDVSPSPLFREGFAARFKVVVTPRFSETYRFTVQSRDRVRVRVEGNLLIDAWEPDLSGEAAGSIPLLAGHGYEVTVEFVDASDSPSLRLSWQSDNQPPMVVPQSANWPRRRAVSPP